MDGLILHKTESRQRKCLTCNDKYVKYLARRFEQMADLHCIAWRGIGLEALEKLDDRFERMEE